MIIVNSRFLTQKTTGVQRFAIEICKELKKSNLDIEFVAPKNILNTVIADLLEVKQIGTLKGHLWEQVTLQFYVLKKKALLISLCNTGPLFIKKHIITIHDLSFRIHPEWNSKIFSFFYNIMIPILAKRAIHVLTVSKTSQKELARELRIKEEKISVVYNAVSNVFKDKNSSLRDIEENYLLTVSSLHPRKNLKRLIDAFLKIPNLDLKLYIIGNVNKHFIKEDLISGRNKSRIKILQNINDEELAMYYKNANLFVYPSLYEGFGIPIIEAMNYNIPVCVSNIEVFKEICGDNATYFNPNSIEDISKKIISSLDKPKPIFDQLNDYSWKKSSKIIESIVFKLKMR